MEKPSRENAYCNEHAHLLCSSYLRWTGKLLLEASDDHRLGELLYTADFAVVSHDTAADPVFNYANRAALTVFEYSWEEFTALPSRYSAEPVNREARAELLAEVTENGFIANYRGVRISKSRRRFFVDNAVVWNLMDDAGRYRGQAACFRDWKYL